MMANGGGSKAWTDNRLTRFWVAIPHQPGRFIPDVVPAARSLTTAEAPRLRLPLPIERSLLSPTFPQTGAQFSDALGCDGHGRFATDTAKVKSGAMPIVRIAF
jgi:hypothetical protein